MNKKQLFEQIKTKKSFLCVGLDPVMEQIPRHLLKYDNPVLEFNKQLIDATKDLCVAYKPNTAFFESMGLKGWETLIRTWEYIPKDIFTIADAKRGDIGNTSAMYADAFFNKEKSGMGFDAITVAPYMGKDSVGPFLNHKDKWVILLALTSNIGHSDFQLHQTPEGKLYEEVIRISSAWADSEQLMYVVGATRGAEFKNIRRLAPDNFLLVPGVGAQGGSLADVCTYGLNDSCGLLVNSARSIIYAGNGEDFAEKARAEALKLQQEMEQILLAAGLI
ncbi:MULTISPECIES: orotidine-5'-phosphate decarboxylase [Pedobacter]|uniref:Orotidine-5'-phosphate decarboxylase n=1 Tax=Pedobacter heparinus (strain ATCC 13125 / DSM 2366 / CIP 104194 / JCM 7457 / NBRC 12017 / NCIMB 9290 / NRRL B-14731 / HIM 762-3) TaxID=485917 RepID=C6Y2Q6_PEDHD|nr:MULTISPECIES: orotidine-5'-phosphate decarboxylase [Pedobacter]ACU05266.1 orotidine 5'-phosphate decarboxylase [Pedobacter heparinus DSM 2366]MBB5439600.1 orotidine-5'-phosphate decarboxylase [Pedobacter sp. AK017]